MATWISRALPTPQLHELEFLLGECTGIQTLYPPDGDPVHYPAFLNGSWEACERFVKFDFYADIPGVGTETFRALLTYSESLHCYRLWIFASSQEEPCHMAGQFHGSSLVLLSDPTRMVWGMQRLRYTFTPLHDGSVELIGERWELDGFVRYSSVAFKSIE